MLLTFGQQLDPLKTECTKLSKYSSSSISTSQLNMNKMKFCSLLPVKATWDQNRDLQHCLRDGGGFVLLHHLTCLKNTAMKHCPSVIWPVASPDTDRFQKLVDVCRQSENPVSVGV